MLLGRIAAWVPLLLVADTGLAVGEEVAPPIDLLGASIQIFAYLCLVVILLALAARMAKKWRPNLGGGGMIRLESGLNLAPGVGVRVVAVGKRSWLLGFTREQVSVIAELTEETDKPSQEPKL